MEVTIKSATDVGSALRSIRQHNRMNQTVFAKQTGVSQMQISSFESGNRSITLDRLFLIADSLNMSITITLED